MFSIQAWWSKTQGIFYKHVGEFIFLWWFAACREGMFGRNCQESCGSTMNCKGLRFCLPDPYGCSCASGWFGSRCEKRKNPYSYIYTQRVFFFLNFVTHVNTFGIRVSVLFFLSHQPVIQTRMDQTADWAATARMGEFVTVSSVVSVPLDGEDISVRSLVGITALF